MKSIDIDSKIKKNILLGKKIPHSTSQPVIHMENGQYVLSSFVFFFNKDDLKKSEVDRPSLWCIADIETGAIIEVYTSTEKEFSGASYDVKYSIKQEGEYDTSREYYEKAFAILDTVRDKILEENIFDEEEYVRYLDMIVANIPSDYKRFFYDLSV